MHRLLAAFISVILGTFGCGHVECDACPYEGLQLRSDSQHVREMTLRGVCTDALVFSSNSTPDGGAGFVPHSARYWVKVARPGICTVDVVFDSGSTAHVDVLMVQTTTAADGECSCPGTHIQTSDGNPVNLDYVGPG
jgi:hypothetical protein